MEMNNNDVVILNRPRQKKRGLSLNVNGRITLRAQPCRLLKLKKGDCIAFVEYLSQPYIIRVAYSRLPCIRLNGRLSQLHGCSVSTVKNLWPRIIGIPDGTKEVDLVVTDCTLCIRIGDQYYEGLAFITRTDPSHCR